MQAVGHINIKLYRCITEDITTDEVIITEERIQHIEEHHPGDYQAICSVLQEAVAAPDYILEDQNPNTGLILKQFEAEGKQIKVVLRLHTSTDPKGLKNSILSVWKIREKEYRRLIRNKKILYKRG